MLDLGFVMGTLGLASGIIAILYSRLQASAARVQAQESVNMSNLQINSELLERNREIRRRVLSVPVIRDEFLKLMAAQSALSELAEISRTEDGTELYIVYRDAMDAAQDAFFLRRKGVLSDQYWRIWTRGHMTIWAKYPGFEKTFRVAAQNGFIHPDFAKFYEPIFRGDALGDVATSSDSGIR